MPKTALLNMQGKEIGQIELSENLFASPVSESAIHMVIRSIMANQRRGTQSAKTRTEVRGGGRKIYRQKGTGNARHHGNRAPQFAHGGVVFAPKPRDYVVKVNKKVRRLALKSALTSKFNEGDVLVVDSIKLASPKTKLMAEVLKNLGVDKKVLLVLNNEDTDLRRAGGNICCLKFNSSESLNTYDLVNANKLIFTKDALQKIEEVYA